MRVTRPLVWLVAAMFVACASTPHPPPPTPDSQGEDDSDDPDSAAPLASATSVASTTASVGSVYAPERTAPPSTKSYEEAMSTPEPLKVDDDRVHLTDNQLNGPMRGVLAGCRVMSSAKITIKTAVQYGRAIGVTVNVRIERPKSSKPPKPRSKKAVKAETKRIAKLVGCVDHNVRAIVWPPSVRRDSFTTEY